MCFLRLFWFYFFGFFFLYESKQEVWESKNQDVWGRENKRIKVSADGKKVCVNDGCGCVSYLVFEWRRKQSTDGST